MSDDQDQDSSFVSDTWHAFKQGFKPVAVKADDNIAQQRQQAGGQTQLDRDKTLSSMQRAMKVQKGFGVPPGQP